MFPGALNSAFTSTLAFLQPAELPAIATFRVMDQYGDVIDKDVGVETTDDEAVALYKNMVTRSSAQAPQEIAADQT